MLEQSGGYLPAILKKMDINFEQIKSETILLIDQLPKVEGNLQISVSNELNQIFSNAEEEMRKLGDAYITTEHFFLAILKSSNTIQKMLKQFNINYQNSLEAIKSIRSGEKVTTNDPEISLEVLSKYAKDLTLLAEQGKLDPVIGRDDELRRVIQILSRRTKNNPVLV